MAKTCTFFCPLEPRRLHQNMEGQLAFFYVVPLYFRKIETFSQLLLNTCGLYFSEISCWLRKCLVPHRFMAFKSRYLQFKVYPEQGRREGNYRSDFRWEDGSWSRYEVKIQRSTGTTRPIGAPCFCLTLWFFPVSQVSQICETFWVGCTKCETEILRENRYV